MKSISLLQLNQELARCIQEHFSDSYWITAELSDVKLNANGHCYLELIEKETEGQRILARARAVIWANTAKLLLPYFEESTKQAFASGIKVLVKVEISYHEQYGLSLHIVDIDPSYTVGDMVQRRLRILKQLEEEGVKDLNKELPFPILPQRIALISSPTAAGYEDFIKELTHNAQGFVFYTTLFPAIMQGEAAESSIIEALNTIYTHQDHFDVVAILRGGGASADLVGFDTYLLAANCAQFPLPIVVGIGHERDETVLDYVANVRLKTPTAVATFLIERAQICYKELETSRQKLHSYSIGILTRRQTELQMQAYQLRSLAQLSVEGKKAKLSQVHNKLREASLQFLAHKEHLLQICQQFISLSSPEKILAKGYSITLKNGKAIKNAEEIQTGDEIISLFHNGKTKSRVL